MGARRRASYRRFRQGRLSCGPRAAISNEAQYRWVIVKGAARPTKVPTTGLLDVDMLLETIKEKVKHRLEHVDVDSLSLYQSQQAKNDGEKAPNDSSLSASLFGCCLGRGVGARLSSVLLVS